MNPEETTPEFQDNSKQVLEFKEFIQLLANEIDKALNPDGKEKFGFSCFVYSRDNVNSGSTLISNCDKSYTERIANVYVNKSKLEKRRKMR